MKTVDAGTPPIVQTQINLPFAKGFQQVSGENKCEANIDWLRFELDCNEQTYRKIFCKFYEPNRNYMLKDLKIKIHPGDPGYTNKVVSELGQVIMWRKSEIACRLPYHVAVILPGDYFSNLSSKQQFKLLHWVKDNCPNVSITRIDAALDIYANILELSDIIEALSAKNYTGFAKKSMIFSDSNGQGFNGWSINLGSRESDSYTRIYHTGVKHNFNAIRFERELKGDCAKAYFQSLTANINKGFDCNLEELYKQIQFPQTLAMIAIGGFNFINRSEQYSNGSLEKCPDLCWWAKFKKAIGGQLRLRIPRNKTTLKSKIKWLNRQVAKTLKILTDGLGLNETLELLLNMMESKELSPQDIMYVAILQEYGLSACAIA